MPGTSKHHTVFHSWDEEHLHQTEDAKSESLSHIWHQNSLLMIGNLLIRTGSMKYLIAQKPEDQARFINKIHDIMAAWSITMENFSTLRFYAYKFLGLS